jgi:universal protein Kae1
LHPILAISLIGGRLGSQCSQHNEVLSVQDRYALAFNINSGIIQYYKRWVQIKICIPEEKWNCMRNKKGHERDGYCLGIESSADDFGVGIATFKGKILANNSDAYIPAEGGIHPREAARHHAEVAPKIIDEAFRTAGIKPTQLSCIAFSQGPGLGPSLRTGATIARALSSYLDIPLVGINHSVAHIEIGKLKTGAKDPVTLYASGGNTMVTAFSSGRYRVFGETLDIALGNCIDVFAREAGLKNKKGLPLGAALEQVALKGKKLVSLPYVVKGMDLSLSGLLTSAITQLHKGCQLEDLCYSLQEYAFSMVTEVTERALAHTEKPEVLLTGGVAANQRLQSMIRIIAEEHDSKFNVVPLEYATDNGAMIAWTATLAFKHDLILPIQASQVKLRWRVDKVDVPWIQ